MKIPLLSVCDLLICSIFSVMQSPDFHLLVNWLVFVFVFVFLFVFLFVFVFVFVLVSDFFEKMKSWQKFM